MSSVKNRCNKHDIVYHYEYCPRCLDDDVVRLIGSHYHRAPCQGDCFMAFGCAPQWQPDEIRRMNLDGTETVPSKPVYVNKLAAFVGAATHLDHGPNPDYRRPKTSAERKGEPIHSGVLMYFPDALAAIARLSKKANDKHNPGEPMGWSRGKSTDHMDCVTRHSLTREAIDPEMGEIEAVNVAWRALAELQLLEEKRLNAAGIMPYSGVTT